MLRKNNRGITLIALVVTIIVLLILAGISISMLTGQNGILNRASEAKEKNERAQKEEKSILSDFETMMENDGESIFNEKEGVNSPRLKSGMIPIKWDENKNERKRSLGSVLGDR